MSAVQDHLSALCFTPAEQHLQALHFASWSVNQQAYRGRIEQNKCLQDHHIGEDETQSSQLACRNPKHDSQQSNTGKVWRKSRSLSDKKLPIDILWESNAVEDRQNIEMLRVCIGCSGPNPERIMGIDVQKMKSPASISKLPCLKGRRESWTGGKENGQ